MIVEDVLLDVGLHMDEELRIFAQEIVDLIFALAPPGHRAISRKRIVLTIANRDEGRIINGHKPVLLNPGILAVFDA